MKSFCMLALASFISFFAVGCALPAVPPYPYKSATELNTIAQKMSDDLESYIRDWLAGRVGDRLPDALVPNGTKNDNWYKSGLYLKNPDSLTAYDQTGIRKAYTIDFNECHALFPDPHCTYLLPMTSYAPFGSKMVIKGQFPHCRFFSAQVTPSFDPRFYYWFGVGEAAIVDADIVPDAGSVNPFKVGANRNATSRNYTLTMEMKRGDAEILNSPAFTKPYYRGNGSNNTRYGSGIIYSGPWMDPNWSDGPRTGDWTVGLTWIRYYRIDKGYDWMAGVPLPKSYMQLASGEKFFVWCNPRETEKYACQTKVAQTTAGADPAANIGSDRGFNKQFGIMRCIAEGMAFNTGLADQTYVRNLTFGVTGCGESQPGIGGYEPSTTCCTHINYLLRGFTLNAGKVHVMAGKLPTYPNTNNATMEGGKQMRYLSFTSYDPDMNVQSGKEGAVLTSICDDEIVLDAQRNYVICYSRPNEKPANATSTAGVTWVNAGPTSNQNMTVRWLSVSPDWYFTKTPSEAADRCSWAKTSLSGTQYDPNILYKNNRTGFLNEYQPVQYYMNKTSFESLGSPVTEAKLKTISWGCGSTASAGNNGMMVLFPFILLVVANGIWILRRRK